MLGLLKKVPHRLAKQYEAWDEWGRYGVHLSDNDQLYPATAVSSLN